MDRFILMIGTGLVGLTLMVVFSTSAANNAIPETTATAWSGDIQSLSYTYDAAGNIVNVVDSSITPTAKTMTYTYDSLHRLTGAESSGFVLGDYSQTYSYDPLGNLTEKSDVGSLVYGGTGFPNPHAVTSVNGMAYSYDANGNLLSDDANTYTWTEKNELETVTTPSGTWSYTYDPFGTRLTSVNPEGETTIYVSPEMEIREGETLYHVFAEGQRMATLTVPHASGTTADLSTLVLGDPSVGTLTFLHQDHLGGIALATDEAGLVTQLYDSHPYGTELLSEDYDADTSSTPYSFTGKEYTEDTGLFYFEARWYDPLIGRFVSEDPLALQNPEKLLMDPQAFNAYAYSRNNPVNYVDPSGEAPIEIEILRNIAGAMIKSYEHLTGNHYTRLFFSNALSDDPGDISFGNNSGLANEIRSTSEYERAMSGIESQIADGTLNGNDTMKFESGDLYTSLGEAAYSWSATKNKDGTYTVDINIVDPYNFDIENYGDYTGDVVNNLAEVATWGGVMNEYTIYGNMEETVDVDSSNKKN